jgi:hypothetical protein
MHCEGADFSIHSTFCYYHFNSVTTDTYNATIKLPLTNGDIDFSIGTNKLDCDVRSTNITISPTDESVPWTLKILKGFVEQSSIQGVGEKVIKFDRDEGYQNGVYNLEVSYTDYPESIKSKAITIIPIEECFSICDCNSPNRVNSFGVKTISMCPPCPSPTTIPQPCDETPLLPKDIEVINAPLQGLSDSVNSLSNDLLNGYNQLLNQIQNISNELTALGATGFSIQATDAQKQKKIQNLLDKLEVKKAERDNLKSQISNSLVSIDNQKNNLRSSANNILGNNSSQDTTDKPIDLQGYKDKIEELDSDFDILVNSENTFGLIEASNTIADESLLLNQITNDYLNAIVSNITPATETEDLTNLDKLTKPHQVVKYLRNQIKNHSAKVPVKVQQLEQIIINDSTNLQRETIETQENIQKALILSMVESGVLNPDTLEINQNPENTFSIQSSKFRTQGYWNDLYQSVKSSYGTVDSFIKQVQRPAMEKAVRYLTDYTEDNRWNQLSQHEKDDLVNTFSEVASAVVPSSPEDFIPVGKAFSLAKKVSKSSLLMAEKALKKLKNKYPDSVIKIKANYLIDKINYKLTDACSPCRKYSIRNIKFKGQIITPDNKKIKNLLNKARDKFQKTGGNRGNEYKDFETKYANGVKFSDEGFPDFSPYTYTFDDNTKQMIITDPAELKKIYGNNFAKECDRLAGFGRDNPKPDGYTWHHHQDLGVMELVPTDVHAIYAHTGGKSLYGNQYK